LEQARRDRGAHARPKANALLTSDLGFYLCHVQGLKIIFPTTLRQE